MEHTGFDTDVEVLVLLPAEVLALERGDDGTRVGTIGVAQVVEGLPGIVAAEVIVTLHAVGGLEGEVVDPGDPPHEVLLGKAPAGTHGPEVTPAGIGVETGGTVTTIGGGEVVPVGEVVVETGQPGLDAVGVGVGVGILEGGRRSELVQTAERITALVAHQVLILVSVVLVTGEQVEMMAAEGAVIGEQLVEGVAEGTTVNDFRETGQALRITEVGVVVGLALVVDEVETEVEAELEAGEGAGVQTAQLDQGTAADIVGGTGILVVEEVRERVPTGGSAGGTVLAPVVGLLAVGVEDVTAVVVTGIEGIDGTHQLAAVENVAVGAAGGLAGAQRGGVRVVVREAHVQAGLEPVVDLALDIGTAGQALEAGHLDKTFLVEVAEGEHVLVGPVTAGNGHLVLLADRLGIGAQVEPVIVPLGGGAVHDLAGVVVEELGDGLGERVVLLACAEDGIGAAGHHGRSLRTCRREAVAVGH